jgi:opacity protein-like surface antigen
MKLATLALCLAFAGAAVAADVTGKWTAQVPGRGGETRETTFNFKASGSTLTGTMSTQQGETEISDGKIEGDNLSFKVKMSFGGNDITLLFKGTVSGSDIKFTREREGGQGRVQEFVAKRAAT